MKQKLAMTLAFALLGVCAFGIALAQTVTKTVTFSWILPLTDTNGNPTLLTKVQLVLSTATIPDNTTIVPIDLAAGVVTNSLSFSVPPGGTVFGRVRACNSTGCSAWSNEASKAFPPVTVPLPPTNVTVVVSSLTTSVER